MALRNPLLSLPVELFTRILDEFRHEKDLSFLWNECRNVSREWRQVIDLIVRKRHLPKTFISYALGRAYFDDVFGGKVQLDVEFSFDRLHEQHQDIAIFTEKNCHEKFRGVMKERLQEKLFLDTPSFWLVPPHIVQVRRTANDTEIPGFEMDWETLELQCDWRGMFTALLSEQKLTGSLVRTWYQGVGKEWTDETRAICQAGGDEMIKVMMTVFKRGAELSEQCTKEARRRRIARQFARDGVNDPSLLHDYQYIEERRALQRIKDMQFTLGLLEFSDDEAEDVQQEEVDNEDGDEGGYDEEDGEIGKEEDDGSDGKRAGYKEDELD